MSARVVRGPLATGLLVALLFAAAPGGAVTVPQDDAGSGRDAPNTPEEGVWIEPGVVHGGRLIAPDLNDYYALTLSAGDEVEVRAAMVAGCIELLDPSATRRASSCAPAFTQLVPANHTVEEPGTWFVHAYSLAPDEYRFSVGVGRAAPNPLPTAGILIRSEDPPPSVEPARLDDEHVVVAVIDSGINPYHDFFAASSLEAHPATYVGGFPASAEPVPLSLDTSLETAHELDAEAWGAIERSTYDPVSDTYDEHLYTFPGTRVIAGITFGEYAENVGGPDTAVPIRDDHGHGTRSAGLAAGADLPAADGNVLIVAVEIGRGFFDDGIRWAARQPWIDVISVSLGTIANAPYTTTATREPTGPEFATSEAVASGKVVFMASGNGLSGAGIGPDRCTTYTNGYTGPSWVVRVGAAHNQTGNPTWWHCAPVDVIARTDVLSASHDTLGTWAIATGTSASTPNAAGHYASLLLRARRAGSPLTRAELLGHLLAASEPAPPSPAFGASVAPEPVGIFERGYGLLDGAALARVDLDAPPRARPDVEAWFAHDRAIRHTLWCPGFDAPCSSD